MQDKVVGLRFWLWNFLFYVTFGVVVCSLRGNRSERITRGLMRRF